MNEKDLAAVILQELVNAGYMASYMAYRASSAAAEKIIEELGSRDRRPGPDPYYPEIGCECGAERIGSRNHATYCPIVTGERKRR